jgi:hypothetical protein
VSKIYLPKSESWISLSWLKVVNLVLDGALRKTALVKAMLQMKRSAKIFCILF